MITAIFPTIPNKCATLKCWITIGKINKELILNIINQQQIIQKHLSALPSHKLTSLSINPVSYTHLLSSITWSGRKESARTCIHCGMACTPSPRRLRGNDSKMYIV